MGGDNVKPQIDAPARVRIPRPPRSLDGHGRNFWRRFARKITWRAPVFLQEHALTACCGVFSRWMRAEQELKAKVLRIEPEEFKVLTKIRDDARRLCIRLARRLGLVSRRRIERTKGPERIH